MSDSRLRLMCRCGETLLIAKRHAVEWDHALPGRYPEDCADNLGLWLEKHSMCFDVTREGPERYQNFTLDYNEG